MIDEKKLIEAIKGKKITIGGFTCGKTWTAGFVEMHNKIIDEIIEIVNDQPKIGMWMPRDPWFGGNENEQN